MKQACIREKDFEDWHSAFKGLGWVVEKEPTSPQQRKEKVQGRIKCFS